MSDLKKLNCIIMALYLTGCVFITSFILITGRDRLAMSFVSPLFLLIPILFEKIFKLKRNHMLNNAFYVFVFFAYCVGVTMGVYVTNSVYDKIVHFFSGMLFLIIGAYIFELLRGMDHNTILNLSTRERILYISFAFLFATSTGPVWEIYEYFYDYFSGGDGQHVLDTGINDTMQDMMACIIGALVMIFLYFFLLRINPKKNTDKSSKY